MAGQRQTARDRLPFWGHSVGTAIKIETLAEGRNRRSRVGQFLQAVAEATFRLARGAKWGRINHQANGIR